MAPPKIVFMTGSSSGIGLATAVCLAKDPDKRFMVIATVISFAEKADLVAAVGDVLDKTVFLKELDVTKDDRIKTVVDEVIKEHGRIDLLINIAGIAITGLVESLSRDQIELTFNINTIGVIRLTQAVLPHMKGRKAGRIITVTSMGGRTGTPFAEIYCASKFATEGFLESVASLARKHNIWVSMIEPAFVQTGLAMNVLNGVEEAATGESVGEVDRKSARSWLDSATARPMFTVDDVVAKISEIIDAEKPVLRYQIPSDIFQGAGGQAFSDFTGESLVEQNVERISGSIVPW